MYFYTISNGEYSDYAYTMIYHEKEFTKIEFCKLYNSAMEKLNGRYPYHNGVAEVMEEAFGFKIAKTRFEINAEYGEHKTLDIEKIDSDETWISVEDYPAKEV
ncbi:hypothetical protein [Paenibacillus tianjinensis]|uniref:Phage protein n=1 Tax=Paenibacillus tianjinensis TaxID=2810347 RepID=A0ABX7L7R2_9BACL|nr:hypothetical protein [Paenibacillus tianjinensis]QSF43398.1 hypothetical protein JRJ22_19215 [Paenibacillus tianjinensis]